MELVELVTLFGAAANTDTGSTLPATDTSDRAGGGNGGSRDRGSRLFASSCSTKGVSSGGGAGVTPDAPAAASDRSAATKAAARRDMTSSCGRRGRG